jgi:hypothetical protein
MGTNQGEVSGTRGAGSCKHYGTNISKIQTPSEEHQARGGRFHRKCRRRQEPKGRGDRASSSSVRKSGDAAECEGTKSKYKTKTIEQEQTKRNELKSRLPTAWQERGRKGERPNQRRKKSNVTLYINHIWRVLWGHKYAGEFGAGIWMEREGYFGDLEA